VHVELGREDAEGDAAPATHRIRIGFDQRIEDPETALKGLDRSHVRSV
jgi:hypothetical protein